MISKHINIAAIKNTEQQSTKQPSISQKNKVPSAHLTFFVFITLITLTSLLIVPSIIYPNILQTQPTHSHARLMLHLRAQPFTPITYLTQTLSSSAQCQSQVSLSNLAEVEQKYLDIETVQPFPQLPICVLVVDDGHHDLQQIQQSLRANKYQNYQTVFMSKDKDKVQQNVEIVSNYSYLNIQAVLQKKCKDQNSLILVINKPIVGDGLNVVNNLHQSYSAWVTYTKREQVLEVHTFYRRILNLVGKNDFGGQKYKMMSQETPQLISLALIQLSQRHKKSLPHIYPHQHTSLSFLNLPNKLCIQPNRIPYQPLFSMDQDYSVNISKLQQSWKKFNQNKQRHYNGYVARASLNITQQKGFKAIEYEQLLFLPKNHSLSIRQSEYYDNLYNTKKYQEKQLPLCITVPGHNNVQNSRYQRAMLSILNQDYNNYQIVFIDDNSDDGYLEKTKQLLESKGFPTERVVYIRNLQRKYSTYNIVHAAHSYCADDAIQVMLDGDDAYIGKQVFKLFNALYQSKQDLWVAYTTYISTKYTYGQSKPILHRLDNKQTGGRAIGHYIGPVRTWYVKLIRQIPLMYHQFKNGTWLDTMSDDALQYCFYEMAGNDRIEYFPEINYLYSMDYGDNAYSTEEKKRHRNKTHKQVTSYQRNQLLDTLDQEFEPNWEIVQIFQQEKGIKFKEIK